MGVLDRFRPDRAAPDAFPTISYAELVDRYDPVECADGVIMVVRPDEVIDPPVKLASGPLATGAEIGTTRSILPEYNSKLVGQAGIRAYDQMRRGDATVRTSLKTAKTPILAARWFVTPFSMDPEHVKQAEFIEWNLMQGMSSSWPALVNEILFMLDFGWYALEKVFDRTVWNGENLVYWKKLAPRHPMDLDHWEWDPNGGPKRAHFYSGVYGDISTPIDIAKLAVFTYDKEGGNITGVSVLRSAYKHWFYKDNFYKIDGIQKERHGIGIPIIKLPPGFSPEDKAKAQEIGRNLRTNERAHVVLPPNWEIMFAKLEGQHVDALASAEHHERMIFQNVMAEFLLSAFQGADPTTNLDIFMKSSRFVADIVRDVFNRYCIPQLIQWNWGEMDGYPELRVRRIGDTQDWRIISFALRNLVGAGILQVDQPLEDWIREEMDLPHLDESTIREVKTPQQPNVGPPRQSTAPGSQQGKRPPGSSAGQDQSGTAGTGTQ